MAEVRWILLDNTDDKLTMVQIMAWCHQAASHYLTQCWPLSMFPYGFTRPQCVKKTFAVYLCSWHSAVQWRAPRSLCPEAAGRSDQELAGSTTAVAAAHGYVNVSHSAVTLLTGRASSKTSGLWWDFPTEVHRWLYNKILRSLEFRTNFHINNHGKK